MSESPGLDHNLPWVIVGYGRVGQSLRLLASQLGATLKATWNRSEEAARQAVVPSPNARFGALSQALRTALDEPCLIWLTVVDEAIEPVFDTLRPHIAPGSLAVHTSGSLPSTLLEASDIAVASLHPLQAISDPHAAVARFPDSYWTMEGQPRAMDTLESLLRPAGIAPIAIEADQKIIYHAAACCAANLLVSLFDVAITMADSTNLERDTARQMLVELGRSSLENLADQSPAQALTGPAARRDLQVIESHRKALADCDDPSILEIYDLLTQRALDGLGT